MVLAEPKLGTALGCDKGGLPSSTMDSGGDRACQREGRSAAGEAGAARWASPSRDMPSARHFCRRQCWHRLRLVRSMGQFC